MSHPLGYPDGWVKRKRGLHHKRWALKFDRCKDCGTREKSHVARGLCTTCYWAMKQDRRTA